MAFIENFDSLNRFIISSAVIILSAAAFFFLTLYYRSKKETQDTVFLNCLSSVRIFWAAFAAGFFISLSFSSYSANPAWCGIPAAEVCSISGSAESDSRRISNGSYMLELRLSEVKNIRGTRAGAGGRTLLFFRDNPRIRSGRQLTVDTELSVSEEYAAVMKKQAAGGFSYLKDSACFTASPAPGTVVKTGWNSAAARFRSGILSRIEERSLGLGTEASGMFLALFTGMRGSLPPGDSELFRRAGSSHILALSGMHLAIISTILFLVLRPLPGRKPAFFISCMAITAYLYLTGFGISLVRAALMYLFCGAAFAWYRRFRLIDVCILAFVVSVIIAPSSFYTPAFRLSFAAVGGIILLSPILDRFMSPWLPSYISKAFAVSVAAQLAVAPLLIKSFGELYPSGIIAGIIIAPMVTVFIWIGITYLITGAGFFAAAASMLYKAIKASASAAAGIPSISGELIPKAGIIWAGMLILILIYSLYRRKADGISGEL